MKGIALWIAAAALLAACGDEPTATNSTSELARGGNAAAPGFAAEQADLATLRAATAKFHNFDRADDAGYTEVFLNMCMVDDSPRNRGGMGYHYVNMELVLDGTVNLTTPEALLYEPGPNGQLRLVGVEYVIPEELWHNPEPPRLFGRNFVLNDFGLWALHVWVWKHNPVNMYADWNPTVSCANASDPVTAVGRHH